MKLLLVAPAKMKIPNDGWGAVEIIIWQLKLHLEALGHQIDILNKSGKDAAMAAQPWKYDYVHLQFDAYAPMWVKLAEEYQFNLIITSHSCFAPYPKFWKEDYQEIFQSLLKAPKNIVLSPIIENTFREANYSGKIAVLPNGTEVSDIKFSKQLGNGKALCLGKIGGRKGQPRLAEFINQTGSIQCDFAGPLGKNIKNTLDGKNTRYLGAWDRNQVHKQLTKYSCLLLPSKSEAHPLVVIEALAAGLSVVVSPEASSNLDTSLPFIFVERLSGSFIDKAAEAIRDNAKYRLQIRKYAESNFDWKVISKRYEGILKKWK